MSVYLTADHPGIGGKIKAVPGDFFVEEIPLYLPSGQGQHVYVTLEKAGLSTFATIKIIAKALNIPTKAIGYAGLKDAQAITRQTLSIDNANPDVVAQLKHPALKILKVSRHKNKLKIGHLAGNRFEIRVRQSNLEEIPRVKTILKILTQQGVPNYFGEQRFGARGNTHRLGEHLIRGDISAFVADYLGRPQDSETEAIQVARALVDQENWQEALRQWPARLSDERRVLAAIVRENGHLDKVLKALDHKLKNFFVSAFQSELFNELLTQRLPMISRLEQGDVAYLHRNGAAFLVEEVAKEQPRADRFEISPSGPLFGPKLLFAEDEVGQRERACLAERNLTPSDLKQPGLKLRGIRRPYRFQLKNADVCEDDGLVVSFELPPGAYATVVMAEIMKN